MSYPMLAPSNTWYTSNTARNTFTTINIVDIADEATISTATESWAAAVDSNGDGTLDDDIMCYVNGTTLTIAGNGSGSIYMNPNSERAFSHSSTAFTKVKTFSGAELLDVSKVTNMYRLFEKCGMTTIDVSNWNTSNVENMFGVFSQCFYIESVDVSDWNTSKVTDMTGIFQGCWELQSLDLSDWDVGNVTSMRTMFTASTGHTMALTSIGDVSNWNTGNVTNMESLFYGCANLKDSVDVSNWNVSNVKTFDHMFAHSYMYGIDVSKWDTSSATNMYALFHTVKNTTIDVSSFDTSKVEAFGQMFEYMSNLTEIKGLENFNTSSGIDFGEMFGSCTKLTKLDLSSFDTRNATFNYKVIAQNGGIALSTWNMFRGMTSLQEIKLGENFTFTGDGTTKSGYSYGVLPTPNNTYIANADGNWYTVNRTAYAPADIPNNTAATYYASVDLVNNIDYLVKNGTILDIADAIRATSGSTDKMTPSTMIENVHEIAEINNDLEEALYSKSEGGKSWYDKYNEMLSLHPEKTVSGSYISVDDVSELPHEVKCKVSGVDNPESVTVTRCGENLLGGEAFAERLFNSGATSSIDREKRTVTLRDDGDASKFVWWDNFKPNTKYTVFLKGKNSTTVYNTTTNISCTFTDGTYEVLAIFDGNNSQTCWTSPANKTIKKIGGMWGAGVATFEYDFVGLFEGALTLEDFEPYNGQTLTPSADGTVEGMTSISPQMNIFTDNADARLDVTYRQSKGMQAEYDAFWDNYQHNGKRFSYAQAFYNAGWSNTTYDPKYSISSSQSVGFNNTFAYSRITDTKVEIKIISPARLAGTFYSTTNLVTIRKITLEGDVAITNDAFGQCSALQNITFEGVIGSSINFQYSPLTKASITNVVEHLSSTASGQTCTFKKTAKEAAFTADEWAELIADKTNWTISLV